MKQKQPGTGTHGACFSSHAPPPPLALPLLVAPSCSISVAPRVFLSRALLWPRLMAVSPLAATGPVESRSTAGWPGSPTTCRSLCSHRVCRSEGQSEASCFRRRWSTATQEGQASPPSSTRFQAFNVACDSVSSPCVPCHVGLLCRLLVRWRWAQHEQPLLLLFAETFVAPALLAGSLWTLSPLRSKTGPILNPIIWLTILDATSGSEARPRLFFLAESTGGRASFVAFLTLLVGLLKVLFSLNDPGSPDAMVDLLVLLRAPVGVRDVGAGPRALGVHLIVGRGSRWARHCFCVGLICAIPCSSSCREKKWRVEDVVGDAADAAPEQINSFVKSKTEVFEKIEESLRPLCMVEDLNDDEVMELCVPRSQQYSIRRSLRLRLREGFAADLTTVRANRTMWDLRSEDDKAELRRAQNREQPELLARSPMTSIPCWTRVWNHKKSASWKQRESSRRSELVCNPTSCRWKCRNTSFVNIPKIPWAGKCLRFNPLSATRECTALMVRCVAGAWKLEDLMRKWSSWGSRQDGSRAPRKLLKYFVEMVDGNETRDTSTWREIQKKCLSILRHFW